MQKRSNTKREVNFSFMFLLILGAVTTASGKLSLGVKFPDLVLEKLELGGVYNIRQLRGIPFVVINQSDKPVEARVEVKAPKAAELKDGYEAIPDTNWMRVVPGSFKMEQGDVIPADVVLSIPKDPSLVGRHFQAKLHARTTGGDLLQVGVGVNFRFSVGTLGPDALKAEAQGEGNALMNFDVDVAPQTYQVLSVPLGRAFDLKKEKGFSMKISNRGDKLLKFKVSPVAVDSRLKLGGYDAGDPAWVTVKPATTKVKPNRIEDVLVTLNIPDVPENEGRKFMFPVKFELDGLEIPLELHSKILVTTEKKP